MKIKPITVVCTDAAAAAKLVDDCRYIGRAAIRRGREVRMLTREWAPATHETTPANAGSRN